MKIFESSCAEVEQSRAQHLSFLVTRQLMLPLDLLILIAPHTSKHIEGDLPLAYTKLKILGTLFLEICNHFCKYYYIGKLKKELNLSE